MVEDGSYHVRLRSLLEQWTVEGACHWSSPAGRCTQHCKQAAHCASQPSSVQLQPTKGVQSSFEPYLRSC